MKRFLSAVLALSLLGTTAIQAEPFGNHGYRESRFDHHRGDSGFGRDRFDRDYGGRHHHGDDAGAAIALGVGLFALTAILVSQHNNDRQDQYERDYPPPDYGPRDGYDNGRGYDTQYGYGPDQRQYQYGPQQNGQPQPYHR